MEWLIDMHNRYDLKNLDKYLIQASILSRYLTSCAKNMEAIK